VRQLYDIQKGARTDYSQMMKQTVANLSEDDILEIVAYIASLPTQPKPHAAEKTGGNYSAFLTMFFACLMAASWRDGVRRRLPDSDARLRP